ncbi:MAG: hypothetical protein ACSHXL_00170 [Bacteroidota bacterium]
MRVSIDFQFDKEFDGYEGRSSAFRDEVEDLYTMAQFLTDAMKGAGFSYVVDVGFEKDDGNIIFGEF